MIVIALGGQRRVRTTAMLDLSLRLLMALPHYGGDIL